MQKNSTLCIQLYFGQSGEFQPLETCVNVLQQLMSERIKNRHFVCVCCLPWKASVSFFFRTFLDEYGWLLGSK